MKKCTKCFAEITAENCVRRNEKSLRSECKKCLADMKRKREWDKGHYKEYPCENCGTLCKRISARALCSLKCRLLGNIVKTDQGCWDWQGKIGSDGYGLIMIDGLRKRVTRVIYELLKEPIKKDYVICHTCDRPCCLNPDHLWQGTVYENAIDMAKKGRSASGINQYSAEYKKGLRNMRNTKRSGRFKKED